MARIRQLPTSVITKIAAGEVIERPASVVKELLENSLDAGATRLDIDVENGGAELIRVVDNGGGIHADDLALAFSNHATSKLESADDLFAVHTLGFRGEALASIGGVSQVTLQARPADAAVGAEVACHGGVVSPAKVWNGAAGTRIEVRHLFFNTPVRRKFLRTAATEMGHICEVCTRIALARPGLHLTLNHNGKSVYEITAAASLLDRIRLFFGKDVSDKLYPIDATQGPAHLYGFIADPACDRGTPKMQYLFLNGRWIRDRSLGHAVQEAFRGLLMTGRYAVAFLYLDMPADHVDVNVHPTKAEVRFRDSGALFSFFLATIRNRLSAENLTARLRPPSPALGGMPQGVAPQGVAQGAPWLTPRQDQATPSLFGQTGFPTFTKNPLPEPRRVEPQGGAPRGPDTTTPPPVNGHAGSEAASTKPPANAASEAAATFGSNGSKAIQLHNAYLVLETPEGMLVIDQHALHERILFEQFKERFRAGTLEAQRLLIPEPVELTADQAAKTLEQREALAELGLSVDDFGNGTLLVTSYPAILGKTPPGEILKSVVDYLTAQERLPTREHLLNELMSLMACHAAVRSGDPLTPEEIAALSGQRHLAQDAHHCPHGRPTALLFTRHELDRQFRRV
ncbi:MAG: DNA mismatch repair endonuclease MutL [Gemmataceae bacterium]|nr:DNA mismatch repair endonuclease MutL [Gemmataceae bacterium]